MVFYRFNPRGVLEKKTMKHSTTFTAICLLLSIASAKAATCLNTDQIENSGSPDGKVLILKMKDGKTWHTALQPACPGITANGFIWDIHGGQVCDNAQILKIVRTGEMCRIGNFVPGEPPNHQ